MMKRLLAGAIVGILLAGCTAGPGPSGGGSSDGTGSGSVDGRIFLSTAITQDAEDFALVDGTRIRLAFNDGGQLSVSAGCNTIGGTYLVADGRLQFDGGSMTEMGCDPALHDQDEWVVEFLGADPELALDGDELTLTAGGTVMTLLDREVADPDLPLTGTTWTVASIISGDAVSTVPAGATATFTFADDGTVAVETGCNTGSGRFEVDGSRLRFVDVAVTEMACDGPAGALESVVLPILGAQQLELTIEAGNLTLLAGDDGLGLTGA